jgi:4-amino-4-deoxy-L-arabinose transferase-like glycosyltransferase
MPPRFNRFFWVLLALGIALRSVALNQPLLDAHAARQCQTAAATENRIAEPGFHLSAKIPWAGDLGARYAQELPVYNYLAIGVYHLIGNLDASGKVVSILLWAISFVLLQFIWRRVLDRHQTNWANALFVFAPLSVFYGQAFMPEMLIQLLAFAFVLLAIRYDEQPTLSGWSACAAAGLLALLIKLPEIAHLYLILIALVFAREKTRALLRPRYWIAAAVTILALKMWSGYLDSVNVDPLSFGSSQNSLLAFIGSWHGRFHLVPWVMFCLYLMAFVLPGIAAPVTAYGLWTFLRGTRSRILGLWLLSLAVFYLLWFGAANQSYYNLVALAPLCALFGVGMSKLLAWPSITEHRILATIATALLLVGPAVPVYRHLFRQDRQVFAAAEWIRANTQPNDVILFRPNHHSTVIDYPFNPTLSYYGKRPTFVWTKYTPQLDQAAALERAKYAVVTLPQPSPSGLLGRINRFRHFERPPEPTDWLEASGFRFLIQSNGFAVYVRR